MNGPLLLGVEIGGTKLQVGLGRGDGRLLAFERREVDPRAGAEGIRAQIIEGFNAALTALGADRDRVEGAGVGFGGPVDSARGRITKSHHVEGWDGFPLADWMRRELGLSVVSLHNDADAAAVGEARFGAGVGLSPILYVTVGSGVGGGLVIDGRVYRGAGAGAVEIGHLVIDDPGVLIETGTLELSASGWSIARRGRAACARRIEEGRATDLIALSDGCPETVTGVMVAEAARLGDPDALSILDGATHAMARGLAHAVTLLAPRRIVLGGGVSMIGEELWLGPIRRRLDDLVFPPFRGMYDVTAAALGEEVVIHGALGLALDAMKHGAQRGSSSPAC